MVWRDWIVSRVLNVKNARFSAESMETKVCRPLDRLLTSSIQPASLSSLVRVRRILNGIRDKFERILNANKN